MKKDNYHEPVLLNEVIENTKALLKKNKRVIDATLGTAGHTIPLLKLGFEVFAIDADPDMLEISEKRLEELGIEKKKYKFVKANFRDIEKVAENNDFTKPGAILFDLGVSNLHFKSKKRGFSFSNPEALLDMRLDVESQSVKASHLLDLLRKDQLIKLFENVLDKQKSAKLAKEVINYRQKKKIEKVADFLEICSKVQTDKDLNNATLPFLALRIAVNSEYENLSEALGKAFKILDSKGKLLVITFHSGEDRIVKNLFKDLENRGLAKIFEIVKPGQKEIEENKKARSAKLRILEKI